MPFVVVYVFFHVLYFIMHRKSVGLIASGATLHAKSIRLASFWMCVRDNRTRSNKYREVAHFPWMLCDFKITIVVTTEQHQHKSLLNKAERFQTHHAKINKFVWMISFFSFYLSLTFPSLRQLQTLSRFNLGKFRVQINAKYGKRLN